MKSAVAAALICALAAPSLAAQPDVDWSKVRQLQPGTRMMLIRPGGHSHVAHFFFADDMGFMALNLTGVEAGAAKGLIRIASEQPDLLRKVTSGTSVQVDHETVMTASGLFAGNRRLAEYDRLIESISRTDVETGVVRLEDVWVGHTMRRATKVLIGVVIATPFLIYPIACMVKGCV